MYEDTWTPFVGEILRVEQEDDNPEDCFAVCIVKGSTGGDNIIAGLIQISSIFIVPFTNFQLFFSGITSPRVGPRAPISHG